MRNALRAVDAEPERLYTVKEARPLVVGEHGSLRTLYDLVYQRRIGSIQELVRQRRRILIPESAIVEYQRKNYVAPR